jgi:hypothetical protein
MRYLLLITLALSLFNTVAFANNSDRSSTTLIYGVIEYGAIVNKDYGRPLTIRTNDGELIQAKAFLDRVNRAEVSLINRDNGDSIGHVVDANDHVYGLQAECLWKGGESHIRGNCSAALIKAGQPVILVYR